MDGQLATCLGLIIKGDPYSSITTGSLLEKLTDCPYSNINVTEFMSFWLFEGKVPLLTIEFGGDDKNSKLLFHYNFLRLSADENGTESPLIDYKPEFDPQFALILKDSNFSTMEGPIIIKGNKTEIDSNFNAPKRPLFFANQIFKGNFVIRYPSASYDAFFEWIDGDDFKGLVTHHFNPSLFELVSRFIFSNWLLQ